MAQFEWGVVPCFTPASRPGFHNMDGSPWTDVGNFPVATTLLAENTALDFNYYPYDRMGFATLGGEDWNNPGFAQWGAYIYHRNEIRKNTGTDWPVIHTCTGQENLLDHGIHTGLYETWGNDGKAYLVGMYPGANAGEVGAVILDIETGGWSSFVQDVGGKFTACTYPLAYGGKLQLATQGSLYLVDPANKTIERRGGPAGATDARDKLFVLSGRLFWAGKFGGRMKVFEDIGHWLEAADLQDFPIAAAGGEWALLQDYSRVALVFFTGLKIYDIFHRYFATFLLEAASTAPASALTITDKSESAPVGPQIPIPLNTSVCNGAQEANVVFLIQTHPTLWIAGGSFVTSATHPVNRFRNAWRMDPLASGSNWTLLGGQANPGVSWVSSRYGMTNTLTERGEKIQVFKVETEPGFPNRLRIHYVGHTQQAAGLQMSVRIYFRDTTVGGLTNREGGPTPLKAATIAHTPALLNGYDAPNGFNNVPEKRIDNVQLFQTGFIHYVVWDLEADLGPNFEGPTPPFQLFMDFAGSMPPL